MPKDKIDTQVTLTVDTLNINQSNRNDCVTFSDNRNDPAEHPGHPKDYVSTVDKGKNITWSGTPDPKSSLPADSVQIIYVLKKPGTSGGADILQNDYNPGNGVTVQANIKDKAQTTNESYYIVFTVNNLTENPYIIDPQLKMASST